VKNLRVDIDIGCDLQRGDSAGSVMRRWTSIIVTHIHVAFNLRTVAVTRAALRASGRR